MTCRIVLPTQPFRLGLNDDYRRMYRFIFGIATNHDPPNSHHKHIPNIPNGSAELCIYLCCRFMPLQVSPNM